MMRSYRVLWLVLSIVVLATGCSLSPSRTVPPTPSSAPQASGTTSTAPSVSTSDIGPREILDQFMSARIRRQGVTVSTLLSDGLRRELETGNASATRIDLFQASNPCWYRYEILSFTQPTSSTVTAHVRVYEHFWGGDVAGGPPRSWEQEVSMQKTPTGWRVDQVGEPRNNREELGEPHGLTASACRGGAAAPTPSAEIMGKPYVGNLRLASYRRIDDHADPKGGTPVYIVDRDVEVRASVQGISRLDVSLALSARDTGIVASGVPSATGEVVVQLHLPEAGVPYVVRGLAVLTDERPGQPGTVVNHQNEAVIPTNAFRVMVEK